MCVFQDFEEDAGVLPVDTEANGQDGGMPEGRIAIGAAVNPVNAGHGGI